MAYLVNTRIKRVRKVWLVQAFSLVRSKSGSRKTAPRSRISSQLCYIVLSLLYPFSPSPWELSV